MCKSLARLFVVFVFVFGLILSAPFVSVVSASEEIPTGSSVLLRNTTSTTCQVPVSILIQWSDYDIFVNIIEEIITSKYIPITYDTFYEMCEAGVDTSHTVILTYDDIGPLGIYPVLKEMMTYANSKGIVGVVGIVKGDFETKDWGFLRSLSIDGWQIANHTKNHPDKGLPSLSEKRIRDEIEYVQQKIYLEIGYFPKTLILPGGVYLKDERINRIVKEMGINFIVGIPTEINPIVVRGNSPFYVGRVTTLSDKYFTPWRYALRIFDTQ